LQPEAIALAAPGRTPITYGQLCAHLRVVVDTLNAMGVGRQDRVAVVLPNGPEMAAAFLGVTAAATCAPLNPAYRPSEFEFYLSDLKAKALIVQSGLESPARTVAEQLGIPIIELTPSLQAEAGIFMLQGQTRSRPAQPGFALSRDVALVLHTSGTTSRPKIVPLAQANLHASPRQIQAVFHLDPSDRCLNIMPLFHIHGLIGAVLSSLAAGASVVCTPGFYAPQFFEWMEQWLPTWYTAVPTMHQAILGRAAAHQETVRRCALRFIRSCSAALQPQLMAELERVFQTPVLESYGMTEASHQMASNPLPPLPRKPGSVGKAAGIQLGIINAAGSLLSPGELGEVVIQGASVTAGYENNSVANENAFVDGWFRTGDQGYLDEDGYLFLAGRIKELINRGGEKISPREVDEVLLDHPAVAQVLTFAIPDPQLGEEVGAAVVLRDKAVVTELGLREFAAARLAPFKVPQQVVILSEIPKGPTGKPQRIGLAQKLGISVVAKAVAAKAAYVAPRTPAEQTLEKIWARLLGVERIGVQEDFFHAGGDSVLATALLAEIQRTFGRHLSHANMLQGATIAYLADLLDRDAATYSALVPLQPHGTRPPFFCVHSVGGEVCTLMDLARHFGPEQPFYGIQAVHRKGDTGPLRIESMAAQYVAEIRTLQPQGPYYLGGYSMGAVAAFEMAQQLRSQGHPVGLLALLDHVAPGSVRRQLLWRARAAVEFFQNFYHWMIDDALQAGWGSLWMRTRLKSRAWLKRLGGKVTQFRSAKSSADKVAEVFDVSRLPEEFRQTMASHYQAVQTYVAKRYPGRAAVFRARAQPPFRLRGTDLGWGPLAEEGIEVVTLPGSHDSIMKEPKVALLAEQLQARLRSAQAKA
jgi:acyl-CoA synthetase (AMP-forming)/AMP-acid ligase II/thioesterase domain-containing protein